MSVFGKESYFYGGQVKQAIRVFASVFSDLYIKRDGKFISVPLQRGFGQLSERVAQDALGRESKRTGAVLPSLSFAFSAPQRDTSRTAQRFVDIDSFSAVAKDGGTLFLNGFEPYNIDFILSSRTKTIGDDLQILEQICSAFQPNLTFEMKAFDDADYTLEHTFTIELVSIGDLPSMGMLESPDEQFSYERDYNFVVKTYIYTRPISTTQIREVVIRAEADSVDVDRFPIFDTGATQSMVSLISTMVIGDAK